MGLKAVAAPAGPQTLERASSAVDMDSGLADVAGTTYTGFDWTAGASTDAVRFAAIAYAEHSGNGDVGGVGHMGAQLMYAQKTGTGTDALIIGGEGRVGAVAGTITIGAALVGTFDRNDENAGTITYGAGFYFPDQADDGHVTNKYAFWNNDADWSIRSQGPINARGLLQHRDKNIEGATAWVHFDATGGTPTIRGSFNVTSISDGGVGAYTVNLTTALTGSGDKSCVATGGGAALTVATMDANLSSNTAFNVYTYSLLTLMIADGPVSMTIHGGTQ
jgi:hypothetical protein